MATRGAVGQPPWWFSIIKAARVLQVPPWVLIAQPASVFWVEAALATDAAEAKAQNATDESGRPADYTRRG